MTYLVAIFWSTKILALILFSLYFETINNKRMERINIHQSIFFIPVFAKLPSKSTHICTGAMNILRIYPRAWCNELALKKIHAKVVKKNTPNLCHQIKPMASILIFSRWYNFSRFFFVICPIIWYPACNSPQTIKVQAAPCQIPLTKNTIKIWIYFRITPLRFPPSGI